MTVWPAVLLLATLLVMLWHTAFGACTRCKSNREPKCKCEERNDRVRRPKWKW